MAEVNQLMLQVDRLVEAARHTLVKAASGPDAEYESARAAEAAARNRVHLALIKALK